MPEILVCMQEMNYVEHPRDLSKFDIFLNYMKIQNWPNRMPETLLCMQDMK